MAIKIVEFDKYCPICEHWNKGEDEDPCWDCLNQGWNDDSHKPIRFIERAKDEQKKNSSERKV